MSERDPPSLEWRLELPRDAEGFRWSALVATVVVLLTLAVFSLHRGSCWLIRHSLPKGEVMTFEAAQGDQGYTIDLATYPAPTKDAIRGLSIFRGDPYAVEHWGRYLDLPRFGGHYGAIVVVEPVGVVGMRARLESNPPMRVIAERAGRLGWVFGLRWLRFESS